MLETPLTAALTMGGLGMAMELAAATLRMLAVRKAFYLGSLVLTSFSGSLILFLYFGPAAVLVAFVALFRVINAMRVLSGRMHARHAYVVTRRSTFMLAALQPASLLVWWLAVWIDLSIRQGLIFLLAVALAAAILLAIVTSKNLKKAQLRPSDKYTSDSELPAVSICLPARNETEDLQECLDSVLASDYPKLEVLVLDDCSQDRTPDIIKSFARSGVRFIAGEEPKKGWLAKNQAYQALANASSGQILLFCGVDTRFDKRTVRNLVGTMLARDKQMISVLPKGRQDSYDAGLVQPMRYWWELALPRRLFNRPPVLSTLWAISKPALEKFGGFNAVSNTVLPEAYFAREISKDDGYSFVRSSKKLVVETVKSLDRQIDTALRVRYPQLRKRPESVLLISLAEVWLLLLPTAVFIIGFFTPLGLLWLLAGLTQFLLGYVHYRILSAWNVGDYSLLMAAFPLACLAEVAITQLSMWRYEFGEIRWKERNICIPVMHVFPRLPRA